MAKSHADSELPVGSASEGRLPTLPAALTPGAKTSVGVGKAVVASPLLAQAFACRRNNGMGGTRMRWALGRWRGLLR